MELLLGCSLTLRILLATSTGVDVHLVSRVAY